MPHINLVPWREHHRQVSQQKFLTLLAGVVIITLGLMYFLGSFYESLTTGQNIKNSFLSSEVGKLDKKISALSDLSEQKENLQRRIRLIEGLQRNRNLGTQIIDEVVKMVPPGVYLTTLEREGNTIKLRGKSESNSRLSQMIRLVESSYLFESPKLDGIVAGNKGSNRVLSDFTMQFLVKPFNKIKTANPSD